MRRHKGTTQDPKQKTTQAQKTPTTPTAAKTATSTGALHPVRGTTPEQGRYTRTEEVHPIRGATPDMGHCTCYVAVHPNRKGALPTDRVHRPLEQVKVWSVCAEVTASHSGEDCLVTVACGLVCRR